MFARTLANDIADFYSFYRFNFPGLQVYTFYAGTECLSGRENQGQLESIRLRSSKGAFL